MRALVLLSVWSVFLAIVQRDFARSLDERRGIKWHPADEHKPNVDYRVGTQYRL